MNHEAAVLLAIVIVSEYIRSGLCVTVKWCIVEEALYGVL